MTPLAIAAEVLEMEGAYLRMSSSFEKFLATTGAQHRFAQHAPALARAVLEQAEEVKKLVAEVHDLRRALNKHEDPHDVW